MGGSVDPVVVLCVVTGVLAILLVGLAIVLAWVTVGRRKNGDTRLAGWESRMTDRESAVATREDAVSGQEAELADAREALAEAQAELERVAGLTAAEARAEVLARARQEARLEAAVLVRDIENRARDKGDQLACEVVTGAIQRLAAEITAESTVSTVPLPGEEMKGRIIGREGRNIRTFEQVTGVTILIDDTPESVLLSCFDPVRRETAKAALTDLVADGRIDPSRIEAAYERAHHSVERASLRAAEDAVATLGIVGLNPGLLPTIGALAYRTSYGQNVLAHSVETGRLAALMAAELGLDVDTCRRAGFLHDIGKALTREVEGTHAAVGADLARRFGEPPDVVHAIAAHHNEVEPRTMEDLLTQAADAISGSRPGARRESAEAYFTRMENLERVAADQPGVDRVFALRAGHEVRVMVLPDLVSDAEACALAQDIARRIHAELTYPGNVKVTVIRESRATALAT